MYNREISIKAVENGYVTSYYVDNPDNPRIYENVFKEEYELVIFLAQKYDWDLDYLTNKLNER